MISGEPVRTEVVVMNAIFATCPGSAKTYEPNTAYAGYGFPFAPVVPPSVVASKSRARMGPVPSGPISSECTPGDV